MLNTCKGNAECNDLLFLMSCQTQSPAHMARGKQAQSESGSEDADMKEAASSEAESMSEDEAASSAEEASDEAEEESEEEESDSDAPKVELPNMTTRGKRMVLDQESGEGQVAFSPWGLQGLPWITMQSPSAWSA